MFAVTVEGVNVGFLVQGLVQGLQGIFDWFGGFGGVPGASDVQFGVVFRAVGGVGVLGEVAFQPYVLGESGKGGVKFGFGKGWFDAEFESVP